MGRRWRGAMPPLQGGLAGSTPNVSTSCLSIGDAPQRKTLVKGSAYTRL